MKIGKNYAGVETIIIEANEEFEEHGYSGFVKKIKKSLRDAKEMSKTNEYRKFVSKLKTASIKAYANNLSNSKPRELYQNLKKFTGEIKGDKEVCNALGELYNSLDENNSYKNVIEKAYNKFKEEQKQEKRIDFDEMLNMIHGYYSQNGENTTLDKIVNKYNKLGQSKQVDLNELTSIVGNYHSQVGNGTLQDAIQKENNAVY